MTRITSLLFATFLTLGIIGSSLQVADAGKRERRIAAGVAIGLLGIAAIARHKQRKRNRRYARDYYYDDYRYTRVRRYKRYPRYVRNRNIRQHRRFRQHRNFRRHYSSCGVGTRYDCNGFLNQR